jgi:hypothetical protein
MSNPTIHPDEIDGISPRELADLIGVGAKLPRSSNSRARKFTALLPLRSELARPATLVRHRPALVREPVKRQWTVPRKRLARRAHIAAERAEFMAWGATWDAALLAEARRIVGKMEGEMEAGEAA